MWLGERRDNGGGKYLSIHGDRFLKLTAMVCPEINFGTGQMDKLICVQVFAFTTAHPLFHSALIVTIIYSVRFLIIVKNIRSLILLIILIKNSFSLICKVIIFVYLYFLNPVCSCKVLST